MPLGKQRDAIVPVGQKNKSPNRSSVQFGDSLLIFKVASPLKFDYFFDERVLGIP